MTDIFRTYKHTVVTCSVADLNTGRIKDIERRLSSVYKDQATMITKLTNILESENKRFLALKDVKVITVTYYMKPETFKLYADYYTVSDGVNNIETKNKFKNKKEKKS